MEDLSQFTILFVTYSHFPSSPSIIPKQTPFLLPIPFTPCTQVLRRVDKHILPLLFHVSHSHFHTTRPFKVVALSLHVLVRLWKLFQGPTPATHIGPPIGSETSRCAPFLNSSAVASDVDTIEMDARLLSTIGSVSTDVCD